MDFPQHERAPPVFSSTATTMPTPEDRDRFVAVLRVWIQLYGKDEAPETAGNAVPKCESNLKVDEAGQRFLVSELYRQQLPEPLRPHSLRTSDCCWALHSADNSTLLQVSVGGVLLSYGCAAHGRLIWCFFE